MSAAAEDRVMFADMERRRVACGLSVKALCRDAGFAEGRWRRGVELGQSLNVKDALKLCLVLLAEEGRKPIVGQGEAR